MTATTVAPEPSGVGASAVFRNGAFLRLWLSQATTQISGNMVLYGLTVIVVNSTRSNTAVSLLILSFLVIFKDSAMMISFFIWNSLSSEIS